MLAASNVEASLNLKKMSEGCFCAFPGEKWRDARPTTRFFVVFFCSWGANLLKGTSFLVFTCSLSLGTRSLSLDHTGDGEDSKVRASASGQRTAPQPLSAQPFCLKSSRGITGKLCRAIVGESLTDSSLRARLSCTRRLVMRLQAAAAAGNYVFSRKGKYFTPFNRGWLGEALECAFLGNFL